MRNGRLFITGFYLHYKEEEKVEIGRRRARRRKKERKGLVAFPPPASLYTPCKAYYKRTSNLLIPLCFFQRSSRPLTSSLYFYRQGNLDCLTG